MTLTALQARGEGRIPGKPRIGDRIEVRWGEACETLRKEAPDLRIDLLFIDGSSKEYLQYLKAAEPLLAPGALVVADNVEVFKDSVQDYLDYVRAGGKYESRTIDVPFEWRDDVPDGMEVSTYLG